MSVLVLLALALAPENAAREAAARFDFDAAASSYRELLEANERQYGANSAEVARTLVEAARLPNWPDAAGAWRRAMDILQVAAAQDPALAEALYRAGVDAQLSNNTTAARSFYERALAAAASSQTKAGVLHNLAVMTTTSDPALAEDYFRRAIRSATGLRLAATLEACAAFLNRTGRAEESAEMKARARRTRILVNDLVPLPKPAEGVYRVADGVNPPRLESKQEPGYSAEARAARFEGAVVLTAEIGTDGKPRNVRVVRPMGMGLDEQAVLAVQQWRFQPGTLDGKPVTVAATIEMNFRLL